MPKCTGAALSKIEQADRRACGNFALDKESPIQGQEPEASRLSAGAGSVLEACAHKSAFCKRSLSASLQKQPEVRIGGMGQKQRKSSAPHLVAIRNDFVG